MCNEDLSFVKAKIMATVFWDQKRRISLVFATWLNNKCSYLCETLKELDRAVKNKRRGMLTKRVCVLHYNNTSHCSCKSGYEIEICMRYSLSSPSQSQLRRCKYHFFTKLKEELGGKTFDYDSEVEEYVNAGLHDLVANFYNVVL